MKRVVEIILIAMLLFGAWTLEEYRCYRRVMVDRLLVGFVLTCVLVIAFLVGFHAAHAHDHSRPELDGWFMSLESKGKSPCCDGSDALRVDDVDWETKDGHYRVRLDGEWVDVPDSAVVEGPNRAGPTMVWPYYVNGAMRGVRCFMPGSMT